MDTPAQAPITTELAQLVGTGQVDIKKLLFIRYLRETGRIGDYRRATTYEDDDREPQV